MSQPIFKPRTFNGDLAHLPQALAPLTRLPHWVVWRWQSRASKGVVKWTKPPYQIASPNRWRKQTTRAPGGNMTIHIRSSLPAPPTGSGSS